MRQILMTATIVAGLCVAGCTPIVKELRHSGGYPGYVMDTRFFDASHSKQLQLMRATMIVSMASRVGSTYIRDGKEAEAFIDYLQATTDEINYLAGNLYPIDGKVLCTDLETTDCDAHSALFESDLPQLEERIMRLVVAALPQRQAASFLDAAKRGDLMSAAWKALRLASAAVDGAHRGAAVHRTGLELRALLVQDGGGTCANGDAVSSPVATVNQAALCMNQPLDSLAARHDTKLPAAVPATAFQALFGVVQTSCGLLPITSDLAEASAEEEAKEIQARKRACAGLSFEPRLRFGGLKGFPKEAEAAGDAADRTVR